MNVAIGIDEVLVGRFIERSQRFRRTGAIVGIVLMLSYLVALASMGDDGIEFNFDVLASIGLAGSICGSILAEGFRVRRTGPRIVSLDVRDPDIYRDRTADQRERVLLVLAAAGVIGAVVTGEHLVRVIAFGAAIVMLALLRPWVMHGSPCVRDPSCRRRSLRPTTRCGGWLHHRGSPGRW